MDLPRTDIRLGYSCNHNCMFCCISEHRKENISTKEAIIQIKKAKKFGSEKIVFTGGEPTIRKDIIKLVSYAKELNFKKILIITNGQMCSYEKFLEKLVHAGLNELCFSIPHYKKEKYEKLTQVKESFNKLIKAIDNAKKYNLQISTITTINKLNYKELPQITNYLIKLNQHFKKFFSEFVLINPTNNAWKYRNELVPRLTIIKQYIHKSLEIAKQNNLYLNIEGVPLCYMEGYFANVVEFHMAKKRMMLEDGKENKKYNESRIKEGKSKSKNCKSCKYDNKCEGVWNGYVNIYGDNELKLININYNNQTTKYYHLPIIEDCNYNCIYCTRPNGTVKNIPLLEIQKKINNLTSDYIFIITGGEPFLNNNIFKIIKWLNNKNIKVHIQTNVSLLNKTKIKQLKNYEIENITINLPSVNEINYKKITNSNKDIKKILTNIILLKKFKIKFNIVIVINQLNYFEIKNIVKKLINLNTIPYNIQFTYLCITENFINSKEIIPKISKIIKHLIEALILCDNNNINYDILNIPHCFFKDLKYRKKCISISKGTIYLTDWGDKTQIEKDNIVNEFIKDEKCKKCILTKKCPGILKNYFLNFGFDEIEPIINKNYNNRNDYSNDDNNNNNKGNKNNEIYNPDIISIIQKIKDVSRITILKTQIKEYNDFLKKNKLIGIYSKIPTIKNEENLFLYIGLNKEKIINCIKAEKKNFVLKDKHSIRKIGLLLGYPKCCIEKYINFLKINNCNKNNIFPFEIWKYLNQKKEINFLMNNYIKKHSLYSHIPCSFSCEKTINIAKKNYNFLLKNFKKKALEIKNKNSNPLLYWNEYMGCLFLEGEKKNNEINYNGIITNELNDPNDIKYCYYDINLLKLIKKSNKIKIKEKEIILYNQLTKKIIKHIKKPIIFDFK